MCDISEDELLHANEDKIVVKVERFKTIQTNILDSVIAMYNVMCICIYICMYMQFEILIICSNSKTIAIIILINILKTRI